MAFPSVTLADWRALVEKELAGKPFDKTLVHEPLAGVPVSPLYVEGPVPDPAARAVRKDPWKICMRHSAGATTEELVADVTAGADALWLPLEAAGAVKGEELAKTSVVLEASRIPTGDSGIAKSVFSIDPLAWRATGKAPHATLAADLAALAAFSAARKGWPTVTVSTLPYHDAGADAADELAIALASGVAYLEALTTAGFTIDEAGAAILLRVAVGRDTFVELAKLRALRECWAKVLLASGATKTQARVHAVSSAPALAVRDPWVNMLRVTTQVFAAITGGADYVTPNAYDEAFGGAPSAHGRRVARNTGLVLREESALGRVNDPAGGSYYLESLTDALARKAWSRFQALSAEGGIAKALASGSLAKTLEASWKARLGNIAKRRYPVLGVSDFANLGEVLPHAAPPADAPPAPGALAVHRDAAPFEALRARAEGILPPPEALLVTLGSFAESRGRVGFAGTFFAAGGIRTRETAKDERAALACLCGTDEAYAAEAVLRTKALKAAGVGTVIVAGRPGELEALLREAGVDGFVYVGCDALATLSDILTKLGAKEPS